MGKPTTDGAKKSYRETNGQDGGLRGGTRDDGREFWRKNRLFNKGAARVAGAKFANWWRLAGCRGIVVGLADIDAAADN